MTKFWTELHKKSNYKLLLLLTALFLIGGCGSTVEQANNRISTDQSQITSESANEGADTGQEIDSDSGDKQQDDTTQQTEGTANTEAQASDDSTSNAEESMELSGNAKAAQAENSTFSLASIPAFTDAAYVTVNNNVPYFSDDELVTTAFENYSALDSQGRCGAAYANICKELMPTEKRGEIGSVKPSGWHTVKYDIVDGKYLYNRCHLIGFQLAGENANEKNLITGTRYMNVDGMLPFENIVADYVKESGNHVLYRVTPAYDGSSLVASGVLMEAKSVEDQGEGILFNVYCYNSQPGIQIDYATGESSEDPDYSGSLTADSNSFSGKAAVNSTSDSVQTDEANTVKVHITDTGSKYHSAGCSYLKKSDIEVTLEQAKASGLTPCSRCNPPQ